MKKIIKSCGRVLCSLFVAVILTNGVTAYADIPTVSEAEVLEQGRQLIKAYYLNEIPKETLEKDNLDDMVKALDDHYSEYFTAEEYEAFNGSINNKFSGIGISVDIVKEGIKVLRVMSESPALDSGIKAGDIIIEADGRLLEGASTEEAVSYIRGVAGTYVNLKIKRGSEVLDFKVMRKELTLATVSGQVLDEHIGYIAITSFGENTHEEFRYELNKLIKAKVDSYIIDLRNNPGGYIMTALDIAGYFIGGEPCTVLKNKEGIKQVMNATEQDLIIDKPVVFLTNEYSASASELLSAAVKDYGKAFFVGETTYGKGVGQAIYSLMDGSYMKLTTIKFTSPKGNEINKIGVAPDLKVKTEEADIEKSLQLGRLLLSGTASTGDKTGIFAVKLNNNLFQVKEDFMKNSEFKTAAEYLNSTVLKEDNTFLWKDNAWVKASTVKAENDSKNNAATDTAVDSGEEKNSATTDTSLVQGDKDELPQVAAAAPNEVKAILPATGSVVDYNFLLFSGILISGVGVCFYKKRID